MHADGAADPRRGHAAAVSPRRRPAWPDWAVALALLLGAFGLLGGAAWAVERLRPPVDVEPGIAPPQRLPLPVLRRGSRGSLVVGLSTAYRQQAAMVARAL